ncbi:unnamed protein product [Phytomonas sp. Hart1]|nr:unnamed protein product [Phytomonas sp. Hart1]|eukprot:CCW71108.1 unnamed protein product [Phytomonas sp. isolate Hart1]
MSNDMIHIVLFKFDLEKLAAEFPGDDLQNTVRNLEKVVPGLFSITLTPRPSQQNGNALNDGGYNYILVSKHLDADALKVYIDHSYHKALLVRIKKCYLAPPMCVNINISAKL